MERRSQRTADRRQDGGDMPLASYRKPRVAGYHWHFLSDDRTIGGHVLDCRVEGARGAYDECSSLLVRLPESESFDAIDVSGVTEEDVDKIERQRGDEAAN